MNILYTCDNNYIWLMGISTISLFENNRQVIELNVYLLGENISAENKEKLYEISQKYGRKIIITDIPKLDIPDSLVSSRWPSSACTRLFASDLLPTYVHNILYLDCDTIIKSDISEIEKQVIDDKVFYGIKDCIAEQYKKNIGLGKEDIYVNAGVLLINLDQMRNISVKQVIDDYMAVYASLIAYADQDVLNGAFRGKIGILDPKYDVMTIDVVHTYKEILILRKPTNYYSEQELEEAVKDPGIIHYTTNMRVIRPWYRNSNHPLKGEFEKYFYKSPWKKFELLEYEFNTKEGHAIGIIQLLPEKIAIFLLGIIHSVIKPLIIRWRAKQKHFNLRMR